VFLGGKFREKKVERKTRKGEGPCIHQRRRIKRGKGTPRAKKGKRVGLEKKEDGDRGDHEEVCPLHMGLGEKRDQRKESQNKLRGGGEKNSKSGGVPKKTEKGKAAK